MPKNVLIVCEAGISASLLVSKMLEEIKDDNLKYNIDYVPVVRINKKLAQDNYDVLLLTPQVIRHEEEIRELITKIKYKSKIVFNSEEDFKYMNIPSILSSIE